MLRLRPAAASCIKPLASCMYSLVNQLKATLRHDVESVTVYRRKNCRKFMTLSNQTSRCIYKCIIIYECCSNVNASSFITFFTYMLRQNVIPFWKELFVAFKVAPNIKKNSLYFSSYRRLYKGHSCILAFF